MNFFVDAVSDKVYNDIQQKIKLQIAHIVSGEIVQSLIAQPPLTCKIIIEAFYYDPAFWRAKYIKAWNDIAVLFLQNGSEILIGNIQSNERLGCKTDSENAFDTLKKLFNKISFPVNSIVRQWNYLEDIIGFDGEDQKYQEFNNVRSKFYGNSFESTGYPAATGIGMNRGGLIIEFVAVKSDELETSPVDNPEQISAHSYSEDVLVGDRCIIKTTPKFERARFFELFNKKLIFISGTASITGEKTIGVGDAVKQTEITIKNIQQLYSDKILQNIYDKKLSSRFGHARVYVKNRKDYSAIKEVFEFHFGNQPVVYIIADICRPDLLVEIEGKIILE
ncbi:MAG: hypothetical protein L3J54_07035 [Draconibacterium sp.]|nr:hypothetical protein [Draconibacterium sp.]